jgi:hypothetical protein
MKYILVIYFKIKMLGVKVSSTGYCSKVCIMGFMESSGFGRFLINKRFNLNQFKIKVNGNIKNQ